MLTELLQVQQASIANIEKQTVMYLSTLRSHFSLPRNEALSSWISYNQQSQAFETKGLPLTVEGWQRRSKNFDLAVTNFRALGVSA